MTGGCWGRSLGRGRGKGRLFEEGVKLLMFLTVTRC